MRYNIQIQFETKFYTKLYWKRKTDNIKNDDSCCFKKKIAKDMKP